MPRRRAHLVTLTQRQREDLSAIVSKGRHPARLIKRARVLLELDENTGPVDERAVVAARAGVSENTVLRVARRFVQTGGDVDATIVRKQRDRPPVEPKVTGEVEARLVTLACSAPPEGYERWSLRLLERHVLLVDDVPDLDHSTIGRVLKKQGCVLI